MTPLHLSPLFLPPPSSVIISYRNVCPRPAPRMSPNPIRLLLLLFPESLSHEPAHPALTTELWEPPTRHPLLPSGGTGGYGPPGWDSRQWGVLASSVLVIIHLNVGPEPQNPGTQSPESDPLFDFPLQFSTMGELPPAGHQLLSGAILQEWEDKRSFHPPEELTRKTPAGGIGRVLGRHRGSLQLRGGPGL